MFVNGYFYKHFFLHCFMSEQKNNPLHGKTLQFILEELVHHYRWDGLAYHIDVNCFKKIQVSNRV